MGKGKRVKMAVSKKQPEKKRQKKKSSLWIIALIAVILLILVGVVFLVLPKFRKEAAPEKPETIVAPLAGAWIEIFYTIRRRLECLFHC